MLIMFGLSKRLNKEDVRLLVEAGEALAYALCYSSEIEERQRTLTDNLDKQLTRALARRGLDMTNQTGGVDKYIDILIKHGFSNKAEVLEDDYNKLERAAQEPEVVQA
jgi:hypothetical protein